MKKLRDSFWLFTGRFIGIGSGLVVTPLVARTLTKAEIGTWALTVTITGFLALFQDGGLGPFVVRHKDYTPDVRRMALTSALCLGISIALILVALAYPLALQFGLQENWEILLPLGICFCLGGMASVLSAELRRKTQFKSLFIASAVPQIANAILTAVLVMNGAGLWTFPIVAVASSTLQLLMLSIMSGGIRFGWVPSLLPEIIRYSRGLVGFNLVNYWARKMDDILVGRFLGTSALAIYANAYRLMLLPITQVTSVFSSLMLPYMSQKQSDLDACRNEFYRMLIVIGFIVFPAMSLLWIQRDQIILWYLGPGWNTVADLLLWFCPLGMLQGLINPLGNCYLISGKNDRFFWIGIVNTAVVIAGFVAGLPFGVIGVAIGYFIANVIMIIPNTHYALVNLGGSFWEWIKKIGPLWAIPLMSVGIQQVFPISSGISGVTVSCMWVAVSTLLTAVIFYQSTLVALIKRVRSSSKRSLAV